MRILIVDDSPAIQIIVRRALEKEGFAENEFRAAGGGLEALEIIADWPPDLIITDWHMPGMTGLELLQVLHQTHTKRHVVGFVTTESVPERLNEAKRNGAAFFLSKPFTDRQLGDAVRHALKVHAAEEKAAAEAAATVKAATPAPSAPAAASAPPVSGSSAPAFGVNMASTIEKYLQQAINALVTLQERPFVDFANMAMPCYLVFYGLGDSPAIRAFCVLDQGAYAMFGRILAELSGEDTVSEQVTALFGEASGALFDAPPSQRVTMLRSQLLAQLTPKLLELLDKKQGRTCFDVSAPGHAAGVMTLIAR